MGGIFDTTTGDQEGWSISLKCCLMANIAFWMASSLNVWVDHLAQSQSGRYANLRRLKKQPKIWISPKEMRDVFSVAFVNMVLIAPLICCPMFEYLWNWLYPPGIRLRESDPFNCWRELIRIPLDMLINELTFYGAHRILHRPWWYQHVHKIHHRFKAPTAMAATYAHPIEFIFGNVFCIALGPIVTNAHPFMAYFWFTMALLSTCKGHSGYDILNARTHDDHHQYTNYNYGVLHLGDYLLGTTKPTTTCTNNQIKKIKGSS